MRYTVRKSTTNFVYYLTNKCEWQLKPSLTFTLLFRNTNSAINHLNKTDTSDALSLTVVGFDKEMNMYFVDEVLENS